MQFDENSTRKEMFSVESIKKQYIGTSANNEMKRCRIRDHP